MFLIFIAQFFIVCVSNLFCFGGSFFHPGLNVVLSRNGEVELAFLVEAAEVVE